MYDDVDVDDPSSMSLAAPARGDETIAANLKIRSRDVWLTTMGEETGNACVTLIMP